MILSLNEVETTAKKAARGAGYPWGLAEEAGKASRWLCARDIDGNAALANLLGLVDGANLPRWAPDTDNGPWAASGGQLCPLIAGAAISDRAHTLRHKSIRLANIVEPALLAPFLALAAQQIKETITIKWPGGVVSTDGNNVEAQGTFPAQADSAEIGLGGAVANPNRRRSRATPNIDVWNILAQFANRTYAPATEESRLKGAGAQVSDND